MMTNVLYRDKAFIFGVCIWLIATAAYFGFVFMGFPLSPVAEKRADELGDHISSSAFTKRFFYCFTLLGSERK